MTFWIVLALMTLAALALVLRPLLRREDAAPARRDYELGIYRAQLDELEREQARGLIGADEAAAARVEIQRRILATDADPEKRRAVRPAPGMARLMAVLLALALPLASGALYLQLGRPDLAGPSFAAREGERQVIAEPAGPGAAVPPIETLIARLEDHLAANPDDLEGWLRLGRSFELTGAPGRAVAIYEQALELHDGAAELHAALAEARIHSTGGIVGERAQAALDRALELDPGNPRARFYRGLALVQRGEEERGLESWVELMRDSPADAPWLPTVRSQVVALAQELGRDPATALPEPAAPALAAPAGPDLPDPDLPGDAAGLQAEVERLSAALEQEPRDWQGWIRLARALGALDQDAGAEAALARGAAQFAGAPFVRQQFAAAAGELGLQVPGLTAARGPTPQQMQEAAELSPADQEQMIRGMVDGLAARLERQPDDTEGWRMLARSWTVLGEAERAAAAYARLAALLPEGSVERLEVEAMIDRLGGAD
jgi:cytochrome c-type biogenesis protein CcmH